ncbi:hypothetical protein NUW58_g4296 [Xylaria curta]|uniref:Uncharacterized protein n=1 Tax=Xylaria curta TaxID=42375 RepID=A0ACC1P7G9_9PEZI|nr:hypothetical protein NUW58_g4296 [Xylaria curta]
MFTCRACMGRAFDALSRYTLSRNPNISRYSNSPSPSRTKTKPSRPSRRYATIATQTQSVDTTKSIVVRESNEGDGRKAPTVGRSTEWAARKELEYLRDPLHIANRVRTALSKDNFELAALITRQASRGINVTVSWNHLIDHQLQNGRLHGAIKLYNEMKKRAQQPNAQTFTIILRGCAKSEHPKLAVGEAIKLYNNMCTVGRIKPNTIHLNAVLQVCAKAGDLDSMFNILHSSNDGLRSPNNLTYTTIFNAMRMTVDKEPAGGELTGRLEDKEIQEEKQNTIKRAKGIWEEVISRWRSGSIIIDEELVCAMGRILLMGEYQDIASIESLIEQTMMISGADEKGSPEHKGITPMAIGPIKAPGAPAAAYALPGNNSLSMILVALEKTRMTRKAVKYWNLFTLHHKVVPDAENWDRLFRVYQCGKNSGRAATALQSMPTNMVTHKHVRSAMKACLRDNLNKSALDNATSILKVMVQNPSSSNVQSLRIYLQIAHASKRSFDDAAKQDYTGAMDSWAKNLATALERLFVAYRAVAKNYAVDLPSSNSHRVSGKASESNVDVVALARKMRAAYDILINEHSASLTPAQMTQAKSRLADLTRLINHFFENEKRYRDEQVGHQQDAEGEVIELQQDVKSKRFAQHRGFRKSKPKQSRYADSQGFEQKFANIVRPNRNGGGPQESCNPLPHATTTPSLNRKPLQAIDNKSSLRNRLKGLKGNVTRRSLPGHGKNRTPYVPDAWYNVRSIEDLLCLESTGTQHAGVGGQTWPAIRKSISSMASSLRTNRGSTGSGKSHEQAYCQSSSRRSKNGLRVAQESARRWVTMVTRVPPMACRRSTSQDRHYSFSTISEAGSTRNCSSVPQLPGLAESSNFLETLNKTGLLRMPTHPSETLAGNELCYLTFLLLPACVNAFAHFELTFAWLPGENKVQNPMPVGGEKCASQGHPIVARLPLRLRSPDALHHGAAGYPINKVAETQIQQRKMSPGEKKPQDCNGPNHPRDCDCTKHPMKWLDRVLATSYGTRVPMQPHLCVSDETMQYHHSRNWCVVVKSPRDQQLPQPPKCYPGFGYAVLDIRDRFQNFYAPFASYNACTRVLTLFPTGAPRPENHAVDKQTEIIDIEQACYPWIKDEDKPSSTDEAPNGTWCDVPNDEAEDSEFSLCLSEESQWTDPYNGEISPLELEPPEPYMDSPCPGEEECCFATGVGSRGWYQHIEYAHSFSWPYGVPQRPIRQSENAEQSDAPVAWAVTSCTDTAEINQDTDDAADEDLASRLSFMG